VIVNAVVGKLGDIEWFDRRIADYESRRNRALREIERHHALFGEALRRSVEEVEDAEFEVIDATATTGKKAA